MRMNLERVTRHATWRDWSITPVEQSQRLPASSGKAGEFPHGTRTDETERRQESANRELREALLAAIAKQVEEQNRKTGPGNGSSR